MALWVVIIAVLVGMMFAAVPLHQFYGADASCANPVPAEYARSGKGDNLHLWNCGWQAVHKNDSDLLVLAYLQPNGSWSWSNAGLVVYLTEAAHPEALLIDTLMDPVLTRGMLDTVKQHTSAQITALAWTHPDVDHILGNQEVPPEVHRVGPAMLAPYLREGIQSAKMLSYGTWVSRALLLMLDYIWFRRWLPALHPAPLRAALLKMIGLFRALSFFADFNMHLVDTNAASQNLLSMPLHLSLDGNRSAKIGPGGQVEYRYFGQIHSKGDSVVIIPKSRIAFAGDLLFVGVHPVMWCGPASAWKSALHELTLLADTHGGATDEWRFVPGHGPVVGVDAVQTQQRYFEWLDSAVTTLCPNVKEDSSGSKDRDCALRVLASMPQEFRRWPEPERVLMSTIVECRARRENGPVMMSPRAKIGAFQFLGEYLVSTELGLM